MAIKYLVHEEDGTPHLPYTGDDGKPDHRLMGDAWAALHKGFRGKPYEGPDKEEAISKLEGLYRSEGMDLPDSVSASEVKNGLVRIAVAYTGKFKKDDQAFAITPKDLQQMTANWNHREIPIDYEHLSGGAAPPGWSKAAAWIKRFDGIEQFGDAGGECLYALVEFTPACLAAVQQKEFRYFSPEIHWNERDEQGKPIGTRLAAGAITNRPFLKDLPPIEISEADYPELLQSVALSESKRLFDLGTVHVPAAVNTEKENKRMAAPKQFKTKKLTDGEHKGKIGVFDGDEMVGLCDRASMTDAMNDGDEDDGPAKTAKATELKLVETSAALKKLQEAEAGRQISDRQRVALTEIAKDGKVDLAKAEQLMEKGELTGSGLLRAQRIERLIEDGVKGGKILPKQRAAIFQMALSDFASAESFLKEAHAVVDVKNHGIADDGPASGGAYEELEARTVAYMNEHKDANGKPCDRGKALVEVSRKDPELWARYKRESAVIVQ